MTISNDPSTPSPCEPSSSSPRGDFNRSSDVEARLDRIESSLQRLEGLIETVVPQLKGYASEAVDSWATELGADVASELPRSVTRPPAKWAIQSGIEMGGAPGASSSDATEAAVSEAAATEVAEQVPTHDVDRRLQAAMELLEQLSEQLADPERLSALSRIAQMGEGAPQWAAMAAEAFDEYGGQDPRLDERMQKGLALLERVTRPRSLEALQSLVETLEHSKGLLAMGGDALDAFAARAARQGVDLHAVVERLSQMSMGALAVVGQRETGPKEGEEVSFYSPEAIAFINNIASAMVAAQNSKPTGLWGLSQAALTSEGRRTLGFFAKFIRLVGKSLKRDDSRLNLRDPRAKLAALSKAQRESR